MPVGSPHGLLSRAGSRLRGAAPGAGARRPCGRGSRARLQRACRRRAGQANVAALSRRSARRLARRQGARRGGPADGRRQDARRLPGDRRPPAQHAGAGPDAGSGAAVVRRPARDVRRPGRRDRRRRLRRRGADRVDLRLRVPAHGAPGGQVRSPGVRRVPPSAGAGLRAGGARGGGAVPAGADGDARARRRPPRRFRRALRPDRLPQGHRRSLGRLPGAVRDGAPHRRARTGRPPRPRRGARRLPRLHRQERHPDVEPVGMVGLHHPVVAL